MTAASIDLAIDITLISHRNKLTADYGRYAVEG
jgi:hypothetical protein